MTIAFQIGKGLVALVDDADFAKVVKHAWHSVPARNKTTKFYAASFVGWKDGRQISCFLHRYIVDAPDGTLVHHINGRGLDCRRSNLQIVTPSEHMHIHWTSRYENGLRQGPRADNTSGFKGVFCRRNGWSAQITRKKLHRYLGFFHTPVEAARAYDMAALRLCGPDAYTNFPREEYADVITSSSH